VNKNEIAENIKRLGREVGFVHIGITDINVEQAAEKLKQWLQLNYHGNMKYLQAYEQQRKDLSTLLPKVKSVICCALNYFNTKTDGYVARYALGRDYHKIMHERLDQLAHKMLSSLGNFNYRCFVDSAPILEKPLAVKAGLGWQGKNSLVINRHYGSWIVIGEIFTDLELPIDKPHKDYCGNCSACINACPTKALVAPYMLNGSRCIAYLTIEHKGSIPIELRPLIGNRMYGCDACQSACPMNKYAQPTTISDFSPRNNFDHANLLELFNWNEEEFLTKMQGSAIRRIGYERWLRNIAVALGNSGYDPQTLSALQARQNHPSALVREHVDWAIKNHKNKSRLMFS
jgi:epoxyqueuosine reductase